MLASPLSFSPVVGGYPQPGMVCNQHNPNESCSSNWLPVQAKNVHPFEICSEAARRGV